MALILSIETSTTVCSVALTESESVLAKEIRYTEQSHSTHLTLLIEAVIKKAGVKMSDLAAVAVAEGPGSYTGLRIGLSTAKGLCYALGIPLIAVSTLHAMAFQVAKVDDSGALLVPMLDARRMEVYTATYNRELTIIDEVRPLVLDENSFAETLTSDLLLFFGNGAGKFQEIMQHDHASFREDVVPEAWAIGLIAQQKYEQSAFEDVAYFEPNYLKAYQATKPKKLL